MESPSTSRRGSVSDYANDTDNLIVNSNKALAFGSDKAPLEWLVGTWRGKGKGIYPTIRDFEYAEECSFSWDRTNPRPLLFYRQKTFGTVGDPPRPMHVEAGFMRVIHQPKRGVTKAEMVVSAPNGVATIEEGHVEGYTITLKTTSLTRSSTSRAPYATGLVRTYTVHPNSYPPTLHYTIDMATSSHPTMTRHLEAVLTKWDEGDDSSSDEEPLPAPPKNPAQGSYEAAASSSLEHTTKALQEVSLKGASEAVQGSNLEDVWSHPLTDVIDVDDHEQDLN